MLTQAQGSTVALMDPPQLSESPCLQFSTPRIQAGEMAQQGKVLVEQASLLSSVLKAHVRVSRENQLHKMSSGFHMFTQACWCAHTHMYHYTHGHIHTHIHHTHTYTLMHTYTYHHTHTHSIHTHMHTHTNTHSLLALRSTGFSYRRPRLDPQHRQLTTTCNSISEEPSTLS